MGTARSIEKLVSFSKNHSATQEIPHSLRNPSFHYHVHKSPPLVSILSQMHPVQNFLHYFLIIHNNIVLPSTLCAAQYS